MNLSKNKTEELLNNYFSGSNKNLSIFKMKFEGFESAEMFANNRISNFDFRAFNVEFYDLEDVFFYNCKFSGHCFQDIFLDITVYEEYIFNKCTFYNCNFENEINDFELTFGDCQLIKCKFEDIIYQPYEDNIESFISQFEDCLFKNFNYIPKSGEKNIMSHILKLCNVSLNDCLFESIETEEDYITFSNYFNAPNSKQNSGSKVGKNIRAIIKGDFDNTYKLNFEK